MREALTEPGKRRKAISISRVLAHDATDQLFHRIEPADHPRPAILLLQSEKQFRHRISDVSHGCGSHGRSLLAVCQDRGMRPWSIVFACLALGCAQEANNVATKTIVGSWEVSGEFSPIV